MSELGFVSPENVCEAMATVAAMHRAMLGIEEAVADGVVSPEDSLAVLNGNVARIFEAAKFRGTFEGRPVLARVRVAGDDLGWSEVNVLVDDRLIHRVARDESGEASFAWSKIDGSTPTAAAVAWFKHCEPVTLANPPKSLARAAPFVRRFMGVLGPILQLEQ